MANECIEADELMHYGVKGQKWHQRRYQNEDGTYTDLGKARRRVGYEKEATVTEDEKVGGKAYKDMSWSERRAAKKRARHNEAVRREQRNFNRDKREAIDKGDLSFISKNISRFTNDEINESITRYKTMQSLKDLDASDKQKNLDKFVDKTIYWLEKGSRGTKAVSEISNNINDMLKKSAERKTTQANLEKTRVSLDKDKQELEWLRHPQKKPKTDKELLELEKQQLELKWLKDPKSKPMTEKDELELEWLKNPKSKPKTEKEEIELKKLQKELEYTEDPSKKPLTEKDKADIAKTKSEAEKNLAEAEKNKRNAQVFREQAELNKKLVESNEAKLQEEKANYEIKALERDKAKEEYKRMQIELEAAEEYTDWARSKWKEAKKNDDPNVKEYEQEYDYYRARENDIRNQTDKAKDYYKAADKAADKAKDSVNDTEKKAKQAAKDAENNARRAEKAENDAAKAEANVDKANAKLEKYEYDTNYYSDDYWDNYERFGGWGKKDKSKTQKSGKYNWENSDREIQDLNQKYLRKLNDAYFKDVANHDEGKLGYSIDRKGNVTTDARDVKWKKTMKKEAGDTRIIDQWVKEMKQKYMKEHGLSAKAAEQKAEDYVDYWLDLYDDDMI